MKTLDYYSDGFTEFTKKIMKRLTVYDVGVIKIFCFAIGLVFASLFPNFTKKHKNLLFISGLIAVIPAIVKTYKTFREVF